MISGCWTYLIDQFKNYKLNDWCESFENKKNIEQVSKQKW